jgi:hypothetical protein
MDYYTWIQQIEDVPIDNVCDWFGIERRGNDILCPDHNDRNFGSCKIGYHNRYKCFACGSGGTNIALLAKSLHLSQNKAADMIAKKAGMCGIECLDQQSRKKIPVSEMQLSYLNLSTCVNVEKNSEGTKESDALTLTDIYNDNEEAFWDIIKGKLNEFLPIYIAEYKCEVWTMYPFSTIGPDTKCVLEDVLQKLVPLARYCGIEVNTPVKKKVMQKYTAKFI